MASQNVDPATSSAPLKSMDGVGNGTKDTHSVSKRWMELKHVTFASSLRRWPCHKTVNINHS